MSNKEGGETNEKFRRYARMGVAYAERAEAESRRAATEHERAEAAQRQVQAERKRAQRLADKLRVLGVEPDGET